MKNYLLLFISLVLLSAAGVYFVGGESSVVNMRWQILAYFTILSFVFHYGMVRSAKGDPAKAGKNFIRYYMAATSFKLLIHLSVILAYSMTHKTTAVSFIISFMVFYAIFTVFEVWTAMRMKG